MSNPLLQLKPQGQSVWYDTIDRAQLVSGLFQRLLDEDGIMGVTSNPTIFQKIFKSSKIFLFPADQTAPKLGFPSRL